MNLPLPSPSTVQSHLPSPLRWSGGSGEVPVEIQGRLPTWLAGDLVRTAPAVFEWGAWRAAHWFDGLGLLYAFHFRDGNVRFHQRLLESETARGAARGEHFLSLFGTRMKRGLLRRVFQPLPRATDNTNVNVVPWHDEFIALTEARSEYRIDPTDLRARGLRPRFPELKKLGNQTAHPHWDRKRRALVNIGLVFGARPEIWAYREDAESGSITIEGRLPQKLLPYLHSFGLSDNHLVVLDHPLRVNSLSFLWSERSFIDHFSWQPEAGGRLQVLDRRTGTWRAYSTEAFFCFHVVNQFEDGDDIVVDAVIYDDPGVITSLETSRLQGGLPAFESQLVRYRLRPGSARAERIQITGGKGFEFPTINYRHSQGKSAGMLWGATIASPEQESSVLRIDLPTGATRSFRESGWAFGEPVFVGRPEGTQEDDGVVLSMATHLSEPRSALFILDASTLSLVARVAVAASIPLGFHGSFRMQGSH